MRAPVARGAAFDQLAAVRDRERPDPGRFSQVVPPGQRLYVRGWVVPLEGETICVRIDGRDLTPVSGGIARPDVAESINDESASFSGFEAFVETAELGPGEHTLELVSSKTQGTGHAIASSTFRIGAPWPTTTLEWRRNGGNVFFDLIRVGDNELEPFERSAVMNEDELITLAGWAFNGVQMKAGVAAYAVVDDADAIRLRYGLDRRDVADVHGWPALRYSGFRGFVHLGAFEAGAHSLRIVILMEDGSAVAAEDCLVFRVR